MQSIQSWVASHAILMTAIVWPLLTMVVNAVFDLVKAHESQSAALRFLDAALSAAGFDAVKLVAALRTLLSGRPPSAGAPGSRLPRVDDDMTPTRPSSFKMAILAGVVLLVGCAAVKDALRFSADEVQCVFSQTDHGATTADAVVTCGIQNTPDVLKFFDDLVAQRAAAHRAAACERAAAAAQDAGAK